MRLLVFGAGKIGRAFLGQVFGMSGYEVVFADIDPHLVRLLNDRGSYQVDILDSKSHSMLIRGVSAVHVDESGKLEELLMDCDLLGTCVGPAALPGLARLLAPLLEMKFRRYPDRKTDIILAENLREAASFFQSHLKEHLQAGFPIERQIGLVETSIGKMVPEVPADLALGDPLLVRAEAYNSLIVDEEGFLNPLPDVDGMCPRKPIGAWVDRKAFIHNLGHASASYFGNYLLPEAKYMYEVLEHPEVVSLTRACMREASAIVRALHPGIFTRDDLEEHIEDLLDRFANRLLGDTVFRVGTDLPRKLGQNDRLAYPIRIAAGMGLEYKHMLSAYLHAYRFSARDEQGRLNPADREYLERAAKLGLEAMMPEHSNLDPDLLNSPIPQSPNCPIAQFPNPPIPQSD